MADKTFPATGADSMDEALHRLSRKPGVKGWIMLDRSTGAVIKTNGQISAIRPAQSPSATNGSNPNHNNNGSGSNGNTTSALPTPTAASFSTDVAANVDAEAQAAHELGSMVYGFMSTAGSLVQEMDTEDELKLLRLRTKKQELVIVPELKYILVVVHDTPPA